MFGSEDLCFPLKEGDFIMSFAFFFLASEKLSRRENTLCSSVPHPFACINRVLHPHPSSSAGLAVGICLHSQHEGHSPPPPYHRANWPPPGESHLWFWVAPALHWVCHFVAEGAGGCYKGDDWFGGGDEAARENRHEREVCL